MSLVDFFGEILLKNFVLPIRGMLFCPPPPSHQTMTLGVSGTVNFETCEEESVGKRALTDLTVR